MSTRIHPELSHPIRAAAIEVHRQLGPGLLESAHESCLAVMRKLLHAIFGLFKTDSLWDATRFCGPVQGAQETGANLVARIGPQ